MSNTSQRAVAVTCLKGGVGKSTTAINTARELVHRGHDVALLDLDPNGHASTALGLGDAFTDDSSLADVLLDDTAPESLIHPSDFGVDVLPSHADLESIENDLAGAMMPSAQLKQEIVDELLGSAYDYIIVDCPASRGLLQNNALYACQNMMLPLRPESGALSGLTKTVERLIEPARKHFDLELLAIVPTDLQDRIDQDRPTRQLLEPLVRRDHLRPRVPNFAFVAPDVFDAIDAGNWNDDLPKPGIRHRAAIDASLRTQEPLRDYDPDCDQLYCYAELAGVVERGGVDRESQEVPADV